MTLLNGCCWIHTYAANVVHSLLLCSLVGLLCMHVRVQELWEDKQNLILFLTLHGEMKLTIDSSYDCVEHCPVAHGFQVMKAGDACETLRVM